MLGGWVAAGLSALMSYNMLRNVKARLRFEPLSDADGDQAQSELLTGVTVAVPVRNEAENLKTLLPLLAAQKIQPKEILFLDDSSTDNTRQLLNDFAFTQSNVRVLTGRQLSPGWRGKVFGLSQLLESCTTPKVIFLDADVLPKSTTAFAELSRCYNENCAGSGLLTVFPRPIDSQSSRLLVDQVFLHLYYFLPFAGQKLGRGKGVVAGCGQVMMAQTKTLRDLNAFDALKFSTHDGLQLARLFDRNHQLVRWVDGESSFSVKMYAGFKQAFTGFSRNSFEASGSWPVVVVMSVVLFWVFILPFVLWPLFLVSPGWLVAFLIVLSSQAYLSRELDLGAQNIVLTPVKSLASVAVHIWGATRVQVGLGTRWRDRVLP